VHGSEDLEGGIAITGRRERLRILIGCGSVRQSGDVLAFMNMQVWTKRSLTVAAQTLLSRFHEWALGL
jgi:hypothetical protein